MRAIYQAENHERFLPAAKYQTDALIFPIEMRLIIALKMIFATIEKSTNYQVDKRPCPVHQGY